MIGNGVHGKIAAEQILIQLFGEGDLVRMAAVGIFAIDAIGCDLIIFMMQDDGNGAMLDARIKGMVEDGLGFLGQGGVVISQSCGMRPRMESRTQPPTIYAS